MVNQDIEDTEQRQTKTEGEQNQPEQVRLNPLGVKNRCPDETANDKRCRFLLKKENPPRCVGEGLAWKGELPP